MRIPRVLIALVACLCAGCILSSACVAQLEISASAKTAIQGLEKPEVAGSVVLYDGGKPQFVPIGIVDVAFKFGYLEVTASDEKRRPVKIDRVGLIEDRPEDVAGTERWVVMETGEVWIKVRQFKSVTLDGVQMRVLVDEREEYLEIGDAPDPPEPPGPGPDPGPEPKPDDPFDGIAARVKVASRSLSVTKRAQAAQAFTDAANRMAKFQIRSVTAGWNHALVNMPPCSGGDCVPLQNLLNADAKNRVLSFNQAVEYYREIAKGLR